MHIYIYIYMYIPWAESIMRRLSRSPLHPHLNIETGMRGARDTLNLCIDSVFYDT